MAVVLENSGLVEPDRIESYIEAGGYQSLYHVLREMSPAEVVEEITRSGLRGRGGAGYPTGVKWGMIAKQPRRAQVRRLQRRRGRSRRLHGPERPGERPAPRPGGDGHRRLRGGGESGLHLRPRRVSRWRSAAWRPPSSRPSGSACSAARNLRVALRLQDRHPDRRRGLRLRRGDGPDRLDRGQAGIPRPRPPYPVEEGLWGCPTMINNVETLANVPPIIRNGARLVRRASARRRARGPRSSPWPARSSNTGLVEVPMGTTLRQIVEEIGGGIPDGRHDQGGADRRPLRRLHPGRVPGHARRLRVAGPGRLDHGLRRHDRHGRDTNMVDVARFFMEFCMDESCGKCIPCRAGTVQMHRLLTRIGQGVGHPRRPGEAGGALRHGQVRQPLRARPVGPQPRPQHAPLLPRRIRGPHPGRRRGPESWSGRADGFSTLGPGQPTTTPDQPPARPGEFPTSQGGG